MEISDPAFEWYFVRTQPRGLEAKNYSSCSHLATAKELRKAKKLKLEKPLQRKKLKPREVK